MQLPIHVLLINKKRKGSTITSKCHRGVSGFYARHFPVSQYCDGGAYLLSVASQYFLCVIFFAVQNIWRTNWRTWGYRKLFSCLAGQFDNNETLRLVHQRRLHPSWNQPNGWSFKRQRWHQVVVYILIIWIWFDNLHLHLVYMSVWSFRKKKSFCIFWLLNFANKRSICMKISIDRHNNISYCYNSCLKLAAFLRRWFASV